MAQTSERSSLIRMLRKVPLLAELNENGLEAVADSGREVRFEPGRRILEQGEPGLSFLLVLEGKVEVRKAGKTIATIGPGGFFGEMTVFDEKPRSAEIRAVGDTRCFGIAVWSFFPLLRGNASIAIGIIKELVTRLRRLEENQ